MKETILISVSAGQTSILMAKYLKEKHSDKYEFICVFSNTGHEREKSLIFMDKADKLFNLDTIWLEAVINDKGTKAKIITYETAYRNYKKNGIDPFESMIAKYGIPNLMNPHCSRELKATTIRDYARSIGLGKRDYKTALGIRSDEPQRLNWDKAYKENLIYLAQFGYVTKKDVNAFWNKQPFRLEIKSYEGNCILCWKKSDRKIFTLLQEGIMSNDIELKAEIEWLQHIESKYGKYVPESRSKQDKGNDNVMFRDNRGINDMLEESIGFIDFAIDESKLLNTASQLAFWDNQLDTNFGCTESCEAF